MSMVMVKVPTDIMFKSNPRERTYMLSRLQTSKVSTNRLPWTNKTNELCINASNVQMAKVSTECPRIAQVQAQKNQYGRFGTEVLIGISPLGVKTLNCKNKDKPTRMYHKFSKCLHEFIMKGLPTGRAPHMFAICLTRTNVWSGQHGHQHWCD